MSVANQICAIGNTSRPLKQHPIVCWGDMQVREVSRVYVWDLSHKKLYHIVSDIVQACYSLDSHVLMWHVYLRFIMDANRLSQCS